MITATKRWFQRNRTGVAVGLGVIGVGYVAGQYVISKIIEAKDRMASDRMSKEKRFQQNQEDCTITVLELLPTVVDDIVKALPAEEISKEIQQKKANVKNIPAASSLAQSDFSSGATSAVDEDGRSITSFQSESYVHASQMGASSSGGTDKPVKTKVQLWHELKIKSITRAFTLIYTLTLLCLLTRIQLNLLGRKNYITSVVNLYRRSNGPTINLENLDNDDVDPAFVNDFETNRKFLTFSWWLLHRGWREIMIRVEIAVKDIFATVKPTEDLSLDRLSSLILDVRRKVEGTTPEERKSRQWLPYLLPSQDLEDHVLRESGVSAPPSSDSAPSPPPQDPAVLPSPPDSPVSAPVSASPAPLRRLLDETSDLVDSPIFTHVLTLLLDAAFSQLTDQKIRMEAFKLPATSALPPPSPPVRVEDVTEERDPATATAKLATIMAVMTREAKAIGSRVPNVYLQAMEGVGELEGFAAVVYSSHFDLEDQETGAPDPHADGRTFSLEGLTSVEADDAPKTTNDAGIAQRAAGVVDAAWGGFESVWGKVTRGG